MVRLKKLDNKVQWEEICKKYGSIFHSLDWINIIEEVFNVETVLLGIFEDQELIGIFPLYKSKKVFNLLMSPLHGSATPFSGPILKDSKNRFVKCSEIIRELNEFIKNGEIDFTQIQFGPPLSYSEYESQTKLKYDSVYKFGFDVEDRYTIILDLDRRKEALWNDLDKNCRTAVRKARKNNVVVSEPVFEEVLDEYYGMAKDVYARWHQPPGILKKMYLKVYEKFKPKNQIKILSAQYKGNMVAGAIFLLYRDIVYFWDGVSYSNFYNVAPNNIIQWQLVEWACEHNFKICDMVGAGIPGVGQFKLSFGGKIISQLQLRKYSSLSVKIAAKTYEKVFPVYRRWRYRLEKFR